MRDPISMIPLSSLRASKRNVRKTDKDADIDALAESIKAHGLLQNLTVRPCGSSDSDTYEVVVDATGQLELPQLTFEQAHRVRTRVTVAPSVGAPQVQHQVSYFFECFGEVARATSELDETDPFFAVASEVRRLGFR